nr:energy-coupled thiamine transporter ThiT [Senegalia massiliensis]
MGLLIISIKKLKRFRFNIKSLTRIGIIAAISIVLYMIKIVPFPQGGGFSLLSVLPIMILSSIFGIKEGIICGIIVGALKSVIQPPFYPLQLPLDYFGGMIVIAFTPIFGTKTKSRLIFGATLAGTLSILFSVLSGVIFFGQFAPEEMNTWIYSITYNLLGYGIEVLLSIIVLAIIPLRHLSKTIKN